jgi:hypothetical protein
MVKSLDTKVADILADPSTSKAFIIADAKDADMAFGVAAPGPRRSPKANDHDTGWKTVKDFRAQIRDVVRQGIVDIVLLSASNIEILAMEERLFENSAVTPAARANDTSDIWAVRGGRYPREASRSFRTATLDHIMYGHLDPKPDEKVIGADLGLYSSRSPMTSMPSTMRCASSTSFGWRRSERGSDIFSKFSIPTLNLALPKQISRPLLTITSYVPSQA